MKLNQNYYKHQMDDHVLIVPNADASFHGLVRGNQTLGDILECLMQDTTEEKIVDSLCEKYKGNRSLIEEDVADVIARLKGIGALDD